MSSDWLSHISFKLNIVNFLRGLSLRSSQCPQLHFPPQFMQNSDCFFFLANALLTTARGAQYGKWIKFWPYWKATGKMKVKFQTFSTSVADSLEFLEHGLKDPKFKCCLLFFIWKSLWVLQKARMKIMARAIYT